MYEIQRVVPPQIPVEAALMLCTWREVHAAFDDFRLRGEKAMVIVGAGPVGLSFARFASLLGFGYVGLVDRHAGKRRKAETLGASEVFASLAELENLPARLGGPLDAVIDAVGSEEAINAALPLIKSAGSICVYDAPVAGSLDRGRLAPPNSGGRRGAPKMDESAARLAVHMIGSLPVADVEIAFRTIGGGLGPHMRCLPDGETGRRRRWISLIDDRFKAHPDLEIDPSVPAFQFTQWDGKVVYEVEQRRIRAGVDPASLAPSPPAMRTTRSVITASSPGSRPRRRSRRRRSTKSAWRPRSPLPTISSRPTPMSISCRPTPPICQPSSLALPAPCRTARSPTSGMSVRKC